MLQLLPTFATLLLLAFWLWMFWDMINNPDVRRNTRFYWLLSFVLFGVIAAGFYYFTHYNKR